MKTAITIVCLACLLMGMSVFTSGEAQLAIALLGAVTLIKGLCVLGVHAFGPRS